MITDWSNALITSGHCDEIGKGEQAVFLSKILMDKTFLRLRKSEIFLTSRTAMLPGLNWKPLKKKLKQ